MRALFALLAAGMLACNGLSVAKDPPDETSSSTSSSSASLPASPAASPSAATAAAPSASSPFPSLSPDYDLAADIHLRTALAKSHFPLSELDVDVVDRVFLLVAPHDEHLLESSAALARDALAALHYQRIACGSVTRGATPSPVS